MATWTWLDNEAAAMVDEDRDEFFDVVDKDNRVIGRERRSVVHVRGLWHRGVYVFLFDENIRLPSKNQLRMVVRNAGESKNPHNFNNR